MSLPVTANQHWYCNTNNSRQNPVICAVLLYLVDVYREGRVTNTMPFRTSDEIIENISFPANRVEDAIRKGARMGLFLVESCNSLETGSALSINELTCPGENPVPNIGAALRDNLATGEVTNAPVIGAPLRYAFNPDGVNRNPANRAYMAPNVPFNQSCNVMGGSCCTKAYKQTGHLKGSNHGSSNQICCFEYTNNIP